MYLLLFAYSSQNRLKSFNTSRNYGNVSSGTTASLLGKADQLTQLIWQELMVRLVQQIVQLVKL